MWLSWQMLRPEYGGCPAARCSEAGYRHTAWRCGCSDWCSGPSRERLGMVPFPVSLTPQKALYLSETIQAFGQERSGAGRIDPARRPVAPLAFAPSKPLMFSLHEGLFSWVALKPSPAEPVGAAKAVTHPAFLHGPGGLLIYSAMAGEEAFLLLALRTPASCI